MKYQQICAQLLAAMILLSPISAQANDAERVLKGIFGIVGNAIEQEAERRRQKEAIERQEKISEDFFMNQSQQVRFAIQQELAERQLYIGSVDGIWGKGTSTAFRQYALSTNQQSLLASPQGVLRLLKQLYDAQTAPTGTGYAQTQRPAESTPSVQRERERQRRIAELERKRNAAAEAARQRRLSEASPSAGRSTNIPVADQSQSIDQARSNSEKQRHIAELERRRNAAAEAARQRRIAERQTAEANGGDTSVFDRQRHIAELERRRNAAAKAAKQRRLAEQAQTRQPTASPPPTSEEPIASAANASSPTPEHQSNNYNSKTPSMNELSNVNDLWFLNETGYFYISEKPSDGKISSCSDVLLGNDYGIIIFTGYSRKNDNYLHELNIFTTNKIKSDKRIVFMDQSSHRVDLSVDYNGNIVQKLLHSTTVYSIDIKNKITIIKNFDCGNKCTQSNLKLIEDLKNGIYNSYQHWCSGTLDKFKDYSISDFTRDYNKSNAPTSVKIFFGCTDINHSGVDVMLAEHLINYWHSNPQIFYRVINNSNGFREKCEEQNATISFSTFKNLDRKEIKPGLWLVRQKSNDNVTFGAIVE